MKQVDKPRLAWHQNRFALLVAVLLSNLGLIWLGLNGVGTPMGDVTNSYQFWANQLQQGVPWFGLLQDWVYPYPDLLFIWGPVALPFDYQTNWLLVAVLANLLASLVLVGFRGRVPAATAVAVWLWVAWQLLLGPVAVSRLDNISVAVALAALGLWLRNRNAVAAFLIGLAIWIKVWPVAVLLGLLTDRKRWRASVSGVAASAVGLLAVGYLVAGPSHLLSFMQLQSGRGIQIEAPVASWWLLGNQAGELNRIYFDSQLITFQIRGDGVDLVSSLMGLAMLVALGVTVLLGVLAMRKAHTPEATNAVVAWTALTATVDLIVFNKVGSPQYYGWLFVPAVMLVVWQLAGWKLVAGWVAVLAALTHLVYPLVYEGILQADVTATWVLVIRNLAVIGLLVYANIRLTQLSSSSRSSGPTLSRSIKKPS